MIPTIGRETYRYLLDNGMACRGGCLYDEKHLFYVQIGAKHRELKRLLRPMNGKSMALTDLFILHHSKGDY